MENVKNTTYDRSSEQINKLFILANVQENIILKMGNPQFKQLAKQKFNKVIKEIKYLNRFINSHLDNNEIEEIDKLTEQIESLFE